MTVQEAFSQILDSPQAPSVLARLEAKLKTERQRRQQFYADIDDDMKAEFINGEVVIQSPVKKWHTDAVANIFMLFNFYVRPLQLGYVGYEKNLIELERNDYEPDVVFWNIEKSAHFAKDQWKFPAPDLVVEVLSAGTAERDRGVKFEDYQAHGISEYWIVDPEAETVEQYLLKGEAYDLHFKSGEGLIHCRAINGLSFPVKAIFDAGANQEALAGLHGSIK